MTQGAAEDLWHLSIDDLFVTPVETPPLEGPGPFVINLSASTAPISMPAGGLSGFEKHKLYQLSRKEDGRDRFRLRLGFFDTPDAANEALAKLRERYPSAFAANAADEDLRFHTARSQPAPRAEPVTTAPAARGVVPSTQVRGGGVRNDTGRRGHKKRDIRRDHGMQARSNDAQGPHRNKPAARHAQHPAKNSAHAPVSKAPLVEDIDVEAILLAALEPAPPSKSQADGAPRATPQAQHSRPQPKPESKPKAVTPRPAAKPEARSSKPAPAPVATPVTPPSTAPSATAVSAPAAAAVPAPAVTDVPAPPTSDVPAPAPVVNTAPAEKAPIQTAVVAAPQMPKAPEVARVVADAPAVVSTPQPASAPIVVVPASMAAPEPVASAAAAISPTAVPIDDESHIITHPRIDEVAVDAAAPQAADIPIDLHFIDRIFDDEKPSDDDTPTVEVLALQSPETPLTAEAKSAPAVEQEAAPPSKTPAAMIDPPQAKPPAPAPSTKAKETRAITPHDIIALLTQPIPVARSLVAKAVRSRAKPAAEPSHEPPAPTARPLTVEPQPPVQNVTGEGDRTTADVSARDERRVSNDAAHEVVVELAPEAPLAIVEAVTPAAAPAAPVASAVPLAPPPAVAADSPVDAMAAQIESELEAVMSLELEVTGQPLRLAPSDSALAERQAEVPQVKLELELELAPEPESVPPLLVDIVEEVTVSEVIVPRREPQQTTAPRNDIPAAAATAVPPHARPSPPAAVVAAPTTSLADRSFEVRAQQAEAKLSTVVPGEPKAPATAPEARPPAVRTGPQAPPPVKVVPRAPETKRVEPKLPEPKRVKPNTPAVARVEPKPRVVPVTEPKPRAAATVDAKKPHSAAPAEAKSHSAAPVKAKTPAAPPAEAAPKRPVVIFDAPVEDMDSTQTLRALTPLELSDDTQSKWFAVQLSLAEDPVKVESLPHIDIFDEYRLYSVSGIDQGRFLHSLRLGFFSSETSAQFVAGYLRTFFESAVIKRVSIAEHDRFADRKAKSEKTESGETTSEPAAGQRASAAEPRNSGAGARAAASNGSGDDSGSNPRPVHKGRKSFDSSPTGRHKGLGEELYEEARQTVLSQSAIRRLPKSGSIWSRLFGQDKD